MDDRRVGAVHRAVRHRLRLRQRDVGAAAGVSQSMVSRLERGRLDELSLSTMRAISRSLEIDLGLVVRWRGGELDRLLDRDHAALVEHVIARLRGRGWEGTVEYTFNHFGERGSVDVLAWRRDRPALLIVEVKTRLVDLQDLIATFDRKLRIVPGVVARERGWRPVDRPARSSVGGLLVVVGTTANRRVISGHASTFSAAFPGRWPEVRAWMAEPLGPLRAVWQVSPSHQATLRRPAPRSRRVRTGSAAGDPAS